MKISIALMCHTSRKEFIPYLIEKLGECRVFVDDGSLGVKKNAMRCWESYDKNADYHLVIQDDAIICDNFKTKCMPYLENSEGIVSFFLSKRTRERVREDGIFFKKRTLTGAVALAIRTDLIKKMIQEMREAKIENDDTIISWFAQRHHIEVCYSKPSLVDHRHGIKSIVEKNIVSERRTAYENIPI